MYLNRINSVISVSMINVFNKSNVQAHLHHTQTLYIIKKNCIIRIQRMKLNNLLHVKTNVLIVTVI